MNREEAIIYAQNEIKKLKENLKTAIKPQAIKNITGLISILDTTIINLERADVTNLGNYIFIAQEYGAIYMTSLSISRGEFSNASPYYLSLIEHAALAFKTLPEPSSIPTSHSNVSQNSNPPHPTVTATYQNTDPDMMLKLPPNHHHDDFI